MSFFTRTEVPEKVQGGLSGELSAKSGFYLIWHRWHQRSSMGGLKVVMSCVDTFKFTRRTAEIRSQWGLIPWIPALTGFQSVSGCELCIWVLLSDWDPFEEWFWRNMSLTTRYQLLFRAPRGFFHVCWPPPNPTICRAAQDHFLPILLTKPLLRAKIGVKVTIKHLIDKTKKVRKSIKQRFRTYKAQPTPKHPANPKTWNPNLPNRALRARKRPKMTTFRQNGPKMSKNDCFSTKTIHDDPIRKPTFWGKPDIRPHLCS